MARRAFRPCMHSQGLRYQHAGIPAVAAQLPRWLTAVLLLMVAAFFASPARASVDLRVEATPISAPIQAFVTVTDATGAPVGGLGASDFTVTLDGVAIQIQPADFTLPPNQDPDQKVSVVFAMDHSTSVQDIALDAMRDAVTDFINAMNDGDFAAIVKFSGSAGASVEQPFTEISASAKTQLISVVMTDYPGGRTNLLDAINLAINQFVTPPVPLPGGPKAVIVITDGGENSSQTSEGAVIDNAAGNSIPIFTIGVGNIQRLEMLMRLPAQTGGEYLPAPNDAEIAAAYVTLSELLNNEYLLTIPSSISDCNQHTLQVGVTGQTATSVVFVRCGAAPPPPPTPAPSGGGGGGGAEGVMELLAGLVAVVARRRRRT